MVRIYSTVFLADISFTVIRQRSLAHWRTWMLISDISRCNHIWCLILMGKVDVFAEVIDVVFLCYSFVPPIKPTSFYFFIFLSSGPHYLGEGCPSTCCFLLRFHNGLLLRMARCFRSDRRETGVWPIVSLKTPSPSSSGSSDPIFCVWMTMTDDRFCWLHLFPDRHSSHEIIF